MNPRSTMSKNSAETEHIFRYLFLDGRETGKMNSVLVYQILKDNKKK